MSISVMVNMIKRFDETWNAKIDTDKLIETYHRDELIGDEHLRRKKQLRAGQAIHLIQELELNEKVTDDELLRAWMYWFVCINAMKHWLDTEAARADLGIKELTKKYM